MPSAKYQIYKDKSGKFRFRLLAANTQVIFQSQGYKTKAAAKNGVTSVKRNGGNKDKFVINKSKNGKVYFTLLAGNKEVIGSSQMYASRDTLRNGLASVMKNSKAPVEEI